MNRATAMQFGNQRNGHVWGLVLAQKI